MIQEKAKVLANTKLTPECWKLTLDARSKISLKIKPGQFINLRIAETMDPLFRRPFSVFRTVPLHDAGKGLEIVYKVVGKGTKKMTTLLPDDEVDIIGPCGNGFWFEAPQKRHVLLGGGVGAAALYMLAEQMSKTISVANLYVFLGAETKNSLILLDEFRKLKNDVKISTDDGTYGYKGVITNLLRKSLDEGEIPADSVVYACGPEPMYRSLLSLQEKYGFSTQVSIERRMACGMGVCLSCVCKTKKGEVEKYRSLSDSHIQFSEQEDYGYALTCMDGPVFHLEEVILNE